MADPHASVNFVNADVRPLTEAGEILFVNNSGVGLPGMATASNDYPTRSKLLPYSTLAGALADCTANRGDVIVVAPGHAETLTAAVAVSVAGVKILGLTQGTLRPTFTVNGVVDGLNVTGANVVIENLYFNEATLAATASINVAAANVTIRNCHFDVGANDTETITWASGANLKVIGNEFVITADGPTSAIRVESTNDGGLVQGNTFNGGSTANTWDNAAIRSTVAHTNLTVSKNVFLYCTSVVVATSVSTFIAGDNEYGIGAVPNAATPVTLYADNGTTVRDGLSPVTPTTVANAISKARTGIGDTVLLLPGTYTLTATYALDRNAMRFGPYINNDTFNVVLTTASDVDLITLTGNSVEIWGLKFLANAAQVTTPALIDLDTGDHCHIHDCYFDANSVAALESINIAATATDTLIQKNYFTGQVATVGSIVDLGARTRVMANSCNQLAADSYFINNDGLATGGAMYIGNYILGDGGAGTAMCLFDSTAPVQFLFAANLFAGTTSATPFGQDTEWTTMFVENYVANNSGGVKIDPVA